MEEKSNVVFVLNFLRYVLSFQHLTSTWGGGHLKSFYGIFTLKNFAKLLIRKSPILQILKLDTLQYTLSIVYMTVGHLQVQQWDLLHLHHNPNIFFTFHLITYTLYFNLTHLLGVPGNHLNIRIAQVLPLVRLVVAGSSLLLPRLQQHTCQLSLLQRHLLALLTVATRGGASRCSDQGVMTPPPGGGGGEKKAGKFIFL